MSQGVFLHSSNQYGSCVKPLPKTLLLLVRTTRFSVRHYAFSNRMVSLSAHMNKNLSTNIFEQDTVICFVSTHAAISPQWTKVSYYARMSLLRDSPE